MIRLLIVAPQHSAQQRLCGWFSSPPFQADVADCSVSAAKHLHGKNYDVIFLELSSLEHSIKEHCERLRSAAGDVVLVALGSDSVSAKEVALESGADDYLTEPLNRRIVSSRMRALLRRAKPRVRGQRVVYSVRHIELCSTACEVLKQGEVVHLYPMEFAVLELLMRNPNFVFSANALHERLWKNKQGSLDSVRTHVKSLRKKIDLHGSLSLITTVRGLGYKIDRC